ncbi:MAG: sensor histidine kinase [Burkholderiaceae bacterium]
MQHPLAGRIRRTLRTLSHQRRHLPGLTLPWLVLTVVGVPLLFIETEKAMQRATLGARDTVREEVRQVLVRTLDLLRHDVIFLAEMPGAVRLDDVSPGSAATRLFESFVRSDRYYDKVRWIDASGRERLRIEQRDGRVVVTPAAALQDRRDSPFFRETAGLPKGVVYFSAIDLNFEPDRAEQPARPMLRAAAPVFDAKGRRGIVIIDYCATSLMDRLQRLADGHEFSIYLLNDQGYWLRGPDPAADWAWQRDAPQFAASRTHPALWQAVSASDSGVLRDARGEWAFDRLTPLWHTGDPERSTLVDQQLGLHVLVHAPRESLKDVGWRIRIAVGTVAFLLIAGGSVFVWRLASSLETSAQRARELERLNRALIDAGRNLDAMRTELARVARLSSLGQMVAGVAHEMHSPLDSVARAVGNARQHLADLSRHVDARTRDAEFERLAGQGRDALQQADEQLRRASGIIQRFQQVAIDRTTLERRRFDLAQIVAEADPLLSHAAPGQPVTVRLDLARGIEMDGYPGPLAQVVSNLLNNAITHGFEPGRSGLVTVSARSAGPDEAVIFVRDNGKGIAQADLSRVFEPFYTTTRGQGSTGLGLHIVHQSITEVLGGSIWIESTALADRPGALHHGTTVTVRLPRVAPPIDARVAPASADGMQRAEI